MFDDEVICLNPRKKKKKQHVQLDDLENMTTALV